MTASASPSPAPEATNTVLVGFDDSPGARAALDWAVRETVLRGSTLEVVVAAHVPGMPAEPGTDQLVRDVAEQWAARARELVATQLEEDRVRTTIAEAPAVAALVEATQDGVLCVVGSRGHSPVRKLLLGSVAGGVVSRAAGPVVVVRGEPAEAVPGPVVVGVDGTPSSVAATVFAAKEARLRAVALRVVSAWAMPVQSQWGYAHWRTDLMDSWNEVYEEAARTAAESAAALVAEQAPDVAVTVETVGRPASLALLAESRGADLLVVGSHGHGPMGRLFLGSVGHALVQTAHCPVAVVRP
jgi:nucleotide-binding universal stress UspA family protein